MLELDALASYLLSCPIHGDAVITHDGIGCSKLCSKNAEHSVPVRIIPDVVSK